MKQYPRWKFWLLFAVLAVCGLYGLPNLYPDVPAIQVSSSAAGGEVPTSVRQQIHQLLTDADLEQAGAEQVGSSWLVSLTDNESQLRAKDVVEKALGRNYVVALNMAPTTPQWLRSIGASPMNLGLDLRGGVHFLIQVDTAAAVKQRMEAWVAEARLMLRDEGVRYRSVEYRDQVMTAHFNDTESLSSVENKLSTHFREFTVRRASDTSLRFTLTDQAIKEIQDYAIDQNRTSLSNRVNELGVGEPIVQRQGADRIVVQLPGVQDAAQARRILGRTATLEFRLVADENVRYTGGVSPAGTEAFPMKGGGAPVLLRRQVIVTGDQVTNASMGFDQQSGTPQVNITLDSGGARRMQRTTAENLKKPMAVLFIETRSDVQRITNEDGQLEDKITTTVEREVINVATIQGVFGSRFQITGLDSPAEAGELALLLRAGGLAAPMTIIEERTIGPSLGAQNIESGMKSMVIGLSLILLYMVVIYKGFGLIANIALLGNLVIIAGVLSLIPGATLTLPGIAGIVLTLGMAVDANVLIFEQIKESLRDGLSPKQAIEAGFNRAFSAILDANLTTVIVAVVLFAAGSGTVQGFAVVLLIGVFTSMFTAIVGSRAIIELVMRVLSRNGRAPTKLSI